MEDFFKAFFKLLMFFDPSLTDETKTTPLRPGLADLISEIRAALLMMVISLFWKAAATFLGVPEGRWT